ncbi:MAG TPA: hypothetical protein EYP24_03300, partial [bacterium (Candidatus Stahlbacteria)]|nr:hypothetical protein [Candidatus Stahlbacteria bacterium]
MMRTVILIFLSMMVVGLQAQNPPAPVRIKGPEGMVGWRIHLPENRPLATPAIDNGLVFLGGGFGSYSFYALDARTGKIAWQIKVGDDGPTGAVVDKGCVVFNTESCILYTVDARTGKVIWQKWLGDPLLSQPAVAYDRVYMAYPGGGKHFLTCLDLKDGKVYWKTPIAGEIISAPVIDDGSVYLATLEGTIYAYDAYDGNLQWKDERKATSAPWVFKGDIYVSQREVGEKIKGKSIKRQYEGFAQVCRKTGMQRNSSLWLRREAQYLQIDRSSAHAARQRELDASVGFANAPASAKIGQAEDNLGVASVSGVWAYQGS